MKQVWDRELDYDVARRRAIAGLEETRKRMDPDDPFSPRVLGHYATFLIQLTNGSRASEAVDAMREWVQTGRTEVQVRVRKYQPKCLCGHVKKADNSAKSGHVFVQGGERGGCKVQGCPCEAYRPNPADVEMRMMVTPGECLDSDRPFIAPVLDRLTLAGYEMFARRHLSNTHSVRYALITMLAPTTPPQVIAKITHHARLDYIIKYTQKRAGEKVLRDLAQGRKPGEEGKNEPKDPTFSAEKP
jgi:hypothetical protein